MAGDEPVVVAAADVSSSICGSDPPPPSQQMRRQLRYIEFYAGVGGWTMALQRALLGDENKNDASNSSRQQEKNDWHCCAALDHSDLCASVYQHNFPLQHDSNNNTKKKKQKKKKSTTTMTTTRIESLTVEQLVAWRADLWMMSPPCQPHTRQHDRPHQPDDDREDARSQSFLHLCQLLSSEQLPCEYRPALILLENVVGFGQSHSCRVFREALERGGLRLPAVPLATHAGGSSERSAPLLQCRGAAQSTSPDAEWARRW